MSASPGDHEFILAMGPVARELLGEPTEDNQARRELRFGTRGSLSISLDKGTFYDHEAGEGGGVIDLLQRIRSLDKDSAVSWLRERGHISSAPPKTASLGEIVATYDYTDAHGRLLFQVVRFDPKDFRQRAPDGNGWKWKMAGVQRVIYRLPEVIAAVADGRTVFAVEGEKAADALTKLGVAATCSPGGAGNWRNEFAAPLKGADVVVLPDNDPQATLPDGTPRWHPDGRPVLPGQDHAADVAKSLRNVAASVRVLMLPDLPAKGDAADWIAAGGTREALESLAGPRPENGQRATEAPADTDAIDAVINRFNSKFMLVNENGKAVIYQPGFDPVLKRRRFDRLSTRDLQTLYMNERIKVGVDDKGRPVYETAGNIWLRHPNRRQFIGGVTFDPSMQAPAGVLNLWEGFAVKPAPGDWSLMRNHIRTIICDGDPIRFDYLIRWIARMFQRPAEQGEVAVVMQGGEGTGKGTLAKALMYLTGHHGLAISNGKHLTGSFNGHLRDVIFLFADEALFAGDRQHVGALKSLISEPYLTVEAKFANAVQTPNFLHVMMASNEAWVVPAAHDARRFLVLELSEAVKGNHDYFAAIWRQMEAGGYASMLRDLLALDLTTFNVRAVPTTEGLQRQRKLSLQTTDAWWLDCLARGYVFRSKHGLEEEFHVWHAKISTELLFASYLEFAKDRGERRPLSREDLGRFFAELKAEPIRWRNGVVGEHIADVDNVHGGTSRKAETVKQARVHGYAVGLLKRARADFTTATGLAVTWDGGAAEDEAA